jgi:hypothetical protein
LLPGATGWLAWRPSRNKGNSSVLPTVEGVNVVVDRFSPGFGEEFSATAVFFAERDGLEARGLGGDGEAAEP